MPDALNMRVPLNLIHQVPQLTIGNGKVPTPTIRNLDANQDASVIGALSIFRYFEVFLN